MAWGRKVCVTFALPGLHLLSYAMQGRAISLLRVVSLQTDPERNDYLEFKVLRC